MSFHKPSYTQPNAYSRNQDQADRNGSKHYRPMNSVELFEQRQREQREGRDRREPAPYRTQISRQDLLAEKCPGKDYPQWGPGSKVKVANPETHLTAKHEGRPEQQTQGWKSEFTATQHFGAGASPGGNEWRANREWKSGGDWKGDCSSSWKMRNSQGNYHRREDPDQNSYRRDFDSYEGQKFTSRYESRVETRHEEHGYERRSEYRNYEHREDCSSQYRHRDNGREGRRSYYGDDLEFKRDYRPDYNSQPREYGNRFSDRGSGFDQEGKRSFYNSQSGFRERRPFEQRRPPQGHQGYQQQQAFSGPSRNQVERYKQPPQQDQNEDFEDPDQLMQPREEQQEAGGRQQENFFERPGESMPVPDSRWIARNQHWKGRHHPQAARERRDQERMYGDDYHKEVLMDYDSLMSGKKGTYRDATQSIASMSTTAFTQVEKQSNRLEVVPRPEEERVVVPPAAVNVSGSVLNSDTKSYGDGHVQIPTVYEERAIEKQYGLSLEDYGQKPQYEPMSPYEIYREHLLASMGPQVQRMSVEQQNRLCSQCWALLSFPQKQNYKRKSQIDRARYQKQLDEIPQAFLPKGKKKYGRAPDIRRPKKYMTPYNFFMQERRPQLQREHPEMSMMNIICEASKIWGEMSAEEKKPYIEKSEEDRARFQEESECYIRQRVTSHNMNRLDPRMQNVQLATMRRPMTGYMFFARMIKQRVKERGNKLTTAELMKYIGSEWYKLSTDEKNYWDLQAGDDRAQYNQRFTEFRRQLDIDEQNGDDTQCLDMLEAEVTFSDGEEDAGYHPGHPGLPALPKPESPQSQQKAICNKEEDQALNPEDRQVQVYSSSSSQAVAKKGFGRDYSSPMGSVSTGASTGVFGNIIPPKRTNYKKMEFESRLEEEQREADSLYEKDEKRGHDPYSNFDEFDNRRDTEREDVAKRIGPVGDFEQF